MYLLVPLETLPISINMNSRTEIENFLQKWTNAQTPPKFGVLIEGKWGAGKTHFINSILSNEEFTKKRTIYLSLFGVKSIQDLETRLFFASANVAQKTIHRGASVAGALLKGALRFDLNGDDKSDGSLDTNFKGLNKFVEKISQNLNDALIIFDDLERCSIPMTEFLGFANQFIEHGDARILFVANAEKMEGKKKKKFDSFKEKVIGHRFLLNAQPDEALESFVSEVDNKDVRGIIRTQSAQIIELFHKSGHQNLRALRQFIWHFTALLAAINKEYLDNNYFLQNLTEQFFVFFTEFKLDLGRRGLGPKDLISGKHTSDNSTVFALHRDKDKEPPEKYKALQKYSEKYGGYDTVIPVTMWIDILQSGLIEPDTLNQQLLKSKYLKSSNPAWRKFWYFDEFDDGVVEQAKEDLLDQFENRSEHDIGTMLHMFALRFMMSQHGIITDDIAAVESSCCGYIDDLLKSANLPPRPTDWRWPQSHRFEQSYGCGYWVDDSYRDNFNKVYKHLNEARVLAFENQSSQIAEEILDALETDIVKFTQLICHMRDVGKYASVPVLHYIAEEKFIDTWFSIPKTNWREVQYALNSRYESGSLQAGKNLETERDWAVRLRESLEARAAALGGYQGLRITRIIPNLPQANKEANAC
ncbi:KAP family NTPase [Hellea sp.]|nr:KAP family NTPase [Hellea sp.]